MLLFAAILADGIGRDTPTINIDRVGAGGADGATTGFSAFRSPLISSANFLYVAGEPKAPSRIRLPSILT